MTAKTRTKPRKTRWRAPLRVKCGTPSVLDAARLERLADAVLASPGGWAVVTINGVRVVGISGERVAAEVLAGRDPLPAAPMVVRRTDGRTVRFFTMPRGRAR